MLKNILVAMMMVGSASAYTSDTDLIKQGEGFRACTYKDTKGIKTVCYGFNLERGATAKNAVSAAGGDYNSLINGGCATQSVCNKLLDKEVQSARSTVRSQYGSISCPAAQAVVVDLAYNLGGGGLAQFKKFKANIQAKNWNGAAAELANSSYCRQVGSRCTRNQKQIKSC